MLIRIKEKIKRAIVKVFYNKTIIIRIDGGVCSQIHFYLIGRFFKEKGYTVLYDLEWYNKYGYDTNHVYVRNFDLLKLSPNLNLGTIEKGWLLNTFRSYFNGKYDYFKDVEGTLSWKNERAPLYMGNYYRDFPELFTDLFHCYFKYDEVVKSLDANSCVILKQIQSKDQTVAVHVRRGDLATDNVAYGSPCDVEYFQKAIQLFINRGSKDFYFFSDEPKWIKENLIPSLSFGCNYTIVDVNGSDKGYMDLVLISSCKHIISSKGSLAKYAALLNGTDDRIIIMKKDATEYFWGKVFRNCKYID